jgi:hypothetical protein
MGRALSRERMLDVNLASCVTVCVPRTVCPEDARTICAILASRTQNVRQSVQEADKL